jgi:hypothetical protein
LMMMVNLLTGLIMKIGLIWWWWWTCLPIWLWRWADVTVLVSSLADLMMKWMVLKHRFACIGLIWLWLMGVLWDRVVFCHGIVMDLHAIRNSAFVCTFRRLSDVQTYPMIWSTSLCMEMFDSCLLWCGNAQLMWIFRWMPTRLMRMIGFRVVGSL